MSVTEFDGLVQWSINPLFRKLIYTPEGFLSIIPQKKLHAIFGILTGKALMTTNHTIDVRFLSELSEPGVDEILRT
jgi:hypothetical protein